MAWHGTQQRARLGPRPYCHSSVSVDPQAKFNWLQPIYRGIRRVVVGDSLRLGGLGGPEGQLIVAYVGCASGLQKPDRRTRRPCASIAHAIGRVNRTHHLCPKARLHHLRNSSWTGSARAMFCGWPRCMPCGCVYCLFHHASIYSIHRD